MPRLGLLPFGTVQWEIETLRRHGLDAARGLRVEPVPLASPEAARLAFYVDPGTLRLKRTLLILIIVSGLERLPVWIDSPATIFSRYALIVYESIPAETAFDPTVVGVK